MTLLAVAIAWTFFRADSFAGAMAMLSGMAGMTSDAANLTPLGSLVWRWIIGAGAIALLMPNVYQLMASYRPALGITKVSQITLPGWLQSFTRWRPAPAWAAGAAAILAISFLSLTQVSEFLYFRF